jgi:hypothetical protein
MKSVHTNAQGKYCTAVYVVAIAWDDRDAMDVLEELCSTYPSLGRSASITDLTITPGKAEFRVLVNNTKQTTRRDVLSWLEDQVFDLDDVTVQVLQSVPERGERTQKGTPRSGTKRTVKRAPHATGKTAR